ncbi:splicing factor 3b subunit 4 [Theileria orientalis]|uniref:Splicing factor 3b subunit 4 n=1 Tax=Theileria orientalis TaxID=68886 RepID=A0A976QW65_THEOR|nr:splicing factor 3b subunit 4 [Theileria orientalis]
MTSRVLDILSLYDRNQEATLYIGNLDIQADEELLWEFFMQAGRVRSINIPRDKVTGQHQGFGFVEYETETDADYALRILNFIKLYHKPLRLNKASKDKENTEIGANLFVGNIDDEVDEKLLHDTFSAFGNVVFTKIVRDEANSGRSYAFVSFDNFESSDAALASMNGQFLCNKPIHVSYAYKKDTKGERHGSAAERLIAANRPSDFKTPAPVSNPPPMPMANTFMPPPMHPLMGPPPMMPPMPPNVFPPNMPPPNMMNAPMNPGMLPQPNMGALPVGMPPLPVPTSVPVIPQNMPPPPMFNMK